MRLSAVAAALCLTAGCNSADDPLAWLAGCWTDGATVERWTIAGGGYLFGHNVSFAEGGGVTFFEQLRIGPDERGPVYHAYPGGGPPTAFAAVEQGGRSITFANPAHDFPQRISYGRKGSRLTATISLIDGSRSTVWSYRPCR